MMDLTGLDHSTGNCTSSQNKTCQERMILTIIQVQMAHLTGLAHSTIHSCIPVAYSTPESQTCQSLPRISGVQFILMKVQDPMMDLTGLAHSTTHSCIPVAYSAGNTTSSLSAIVVTGSKLTELYLSFANS
jgi:hypothetical protein